MTLREPQGPKAFEIKVGEVEPQGM